jgi:hypothetical protein
MVVGDAADWVEAAEIVLVWVVQAMREDDVEGSVRLLGCEEIVCKLAI